MNNPYDIKVNFKTVIDLITFHGYTEEEALDEISIMIKTELKYQMSMYKESLSTLKENMLCTDIKVNN